MSHRGRQLRISGFHATRNTLCSINKGCRESTVLHGISHHTDRCIKNHTHVLRYSGCPHRSQAVPLIPAFRTHRHGDLCELEVSLLYIGTSRSAKVTSKTIFKKKWGGAVRRKNSSSSSR